MEIRVHMGWTEPIALDHSKHPYYYLPITILYMVIIEANMVDDDDDDDDIK